MRRLFKCYGLVLFIKCTGAICKHILMLTKRRANTAEKAGLTDDTAMEWTLTVVLTLSESMHKQLGSFGGSWGYVVLITNSE